MKKLIEMYIKLEADRSIDPKKHIITPGGYECNNKKFDFYRHEGNRINGDDTQVEFWLTDFDGTLQTEDEEIFITPKDIKKGFEEFYIYTGEYDDPEIYIKEIIDIGFTFYDKEKDKISTMNGTKDLINNINKLITEQNKELGIETWKEYVVCIEERFDDGDVKTSDPVFRTRSKDIAIEKAKEFLDDNEFVVIEAWDTENDSFLETIKEDEILENIEEER